MERAADLPVEALDSLAAMLIQAHLTNGNPAAAVEWVSTRWPLVPYLPTCAGKTRGALAIAMCMIGRTDKAQKLLDNLPADPFDLPLTRRDDARPRGQIRRWTDDLTAAARDFGAAAGAPHYGISPYAVMSSALLGQAQVRIGQWDDAVTNLDRAASLVDDMEQSWLTSFVHGLSVLVLAGRGEWSTAERHLKPCMGGSAQHPTVAHVAYVTDAGVHLAACDKTGTWLSSGPGHSSTARDPAGAGNLSLGPCTSRTRLSGWADGTKHKTSLMSFRRLRGSVGGRPGSRAWRGSAPPWPSSSTTGSCTSLVSRGDHCRRRA